MFQPSGNNNSQEAQEQCKTRVVLCVINGQKNLQITHQYLKELFEQNGGQVLKILAFERSMKKWQALIELQEISQAQSCKDKLNGFKNQFESWIMYVYSTPKKEIIFQGNNQNGIDYTRSKQSGDSGGFLNDSSQQYATYSTNNSYPPVPSNNGQNLLQTPLGLEHIKQAESDIFNYSQLMQQLKPNQQKNNDLGPFVSQDITKNQQLGNKLHEKQGDDQDFQDMSDLEDDDFDEIQNNNNNNLQQQFKSMSINDSGNQKSSELAYFKNSNNQIGNSVLSNLSNDSAKQKVDELNAMIHIEENKKLEIESQIDQIQVTINYLTKKINVNKRKNEQQLLQQNEKEYKANYDQQQYLKSQLEQIEQNIEDYQIDLDYQIEQQQVAIKNQEKQIKLEQQQQQKIQQQTFMFGTISGSGGSSGLTDFQPQQQNLQNSGNIIQNKSIYARIFKPEYVSMIMLYNIFSLYGNIVKMVFFKPKFSCLVEFQDVEQAQLTQKYLHDLAFFQEKIKIFPANKDQVYSHKNNPDNEYYSGDEAQFRFKNKKLPSHAAPPSDTLQIRKLTPEAFNTPQAKALFQKVGNIVSYNVLKSKNNQFMIYIQYSNKEIALQTLSLLHGHKIQGARIYISFAKV